ncbi:MAG: hypothetical protein HRU38_15780 [Saccharospirillaceae bacterium]|nr:hypothetical protein [Pseudomonadales bacterium]NRB80101.1 hypothetical protein [Saccharospirillaceae bacterium]
MSIEYRFKFNDLNQEDLSYEVDVKKNGNEHLRVTQPAKWTKLENEQCVNCPYKVGEVSHCPAALDIEKIVNDFSQLPGYKKIDIEVITKERTVSKHTGVEQGLRSLLGLVMANSSCPILKKLKPMTYTHLPFASQNEFIIRSVESYLMRQYFLNQENSSGDWELTELIELNKQLQLVNQAIWQRIHVACQNDSNLKALLNFFTLSSSVTNSLESQLQNIKPFFINKD